MSSLFNSNNGSILDSYVMNKTKFENYIGIGKSLAEVRFMFCKAILNWAGEDTYGLDIVEYCKGDGLKHVDFLLDKWCLQTYGMPYSTVYHLIQDATVAEFEDLMVDLGIRGNPSAIAIANEVIRKKENSGIVQVNFVNKLPLESDNDDYE